MSKYPDAITMPQVTHHAPTHAMPCQTAHLGPPLQPLARPPARRMMLSWPMCCSTPPPTLKVSSAILISMSADGEAVGRRSLAADYMALAEQQAAKVQKAGR